jgi:hypothetical protein
MTAKSPSLVAHGAGVRAPHQCEGAPRARMLAMDAGWSSHHGPCTVDVRDGGGGQVQRVDGVGSQAHVSGPRPVSPRGSGNRQSDFSRASDRLARLRAASVRADWWYRRANVGLFPLEREELGASTKGGGSVKRLTTYR